MITNCKDYILDMNLMSDFKDGFSVILATKQTLKLLVKHGMMISFTDGTYGLVDRKNIQVVPLMVAHTKTKQVSLTFSSFLLS